MAQISRENGGPGVVVGTVVQRAHYFGVSKNLQPITDPKQFKGLTIVTSPEPNTNYSVAKRLLGEGGTEGRRRRHDRSGQSRAPKSPPCWRVRPISRSPTSRASRRPQAQGAKVVFDFSSYIGPFCNTGIMVLPSTIQKDPDDGAGARDVVRGSLAQDLRGSRLLPSRSRAWSSRICPAKSSTRRSTPN